MRLADSEFISTATMPRALLGSDSQRIHFAESRATQGPGTAYGLPLAALLGVHGTPPMLLLSSANSLQMAVTRFRSDVGLPKPSTSIPKQEAYILVLQLKDVETQRWCLGEKSQPSARYERGAVSIIDLGSGPVALQSSAFDCLHFYVPYDAIEDHANDSGAKRRPTLVCSRGAIDPIAHQLGLSTVGAMREPGAMSKVFVNHALRALLAHFVRAYAGSTPEPVTIRGGLAPWQTRRAKEMLLANVGGGATLQTVARHCELSNSHFVRAFRQTIGKPPHRWLVEQRVALAKSLLLTTQRPVADIALSVGFSDQACFTRAFKRAVGVAPGGWRRTHRV